MAEFGLASYTDGSSVAPAFYIDGRLVDMRSAASADGGKNVPDWLDEGLDGIFRHWQSRRETVLAMGEQATTLYVDGRIEALSDSVRVLAPFKPERLFGAASNYVEHADEMGTVLAEKANSNPFIFMKASTCVVGHGEAVVKPKTCTMLDWEVELGVVIGRRCRNVAVDQAEDVIAGFTIINDVTARDLNVRDDFPFKFDWFQGKSWDTFGPMGPCVVPASFFGDPHNVGLRLTVNEEVMQDGNTDKLIFNVFEQIAYLSNLLTLLPGDVIATGTPDGVGMGRGIFLKKGDVMTASVDGIGSLTNHVVEESDTPD